MRRFVEWVCGVGRLLCCGLALAALLGGAGPVWAQAGLKAQLAEAAKRIATAMGNTPVKVGEFTGPQRLQSSGGPGIAKALTDALKKQKVKVEDTARFTVDGDFSDLNDEQTGRLAVRINLRLKGPQGDVQLEFARTILPKDAKDTSIQELLGVSGNVAASSDEDRDALIRASLKDPKVTIQGARVSVGPKSLYALEVLVKDGDNYVSRTPESVGGRAFIRLKRDEVYAVRLVNKSNYDCWATLTIDGINVFAFSEVKDATGDPKSSHLIMQKSSSALLKGWYLTNKDVASFVVTDLPKSAGGALKSSSSVGTITASFGVAVAKGKPLPSDEPKTRAIDPNATGVGTKVDATFGEAERTFGILRETISIRYTK
jgi:hypothetical protein